MERVSGVGSPIPVTRRGQRTAYNRLMDDQRIGPEDYVEGMDGEEDDGACGRVVVGGCACGSVDYSSFSGMSLLHDGFSLPFRPHIYTQHADEHEHDEHDICCYVCSHTNHARVLLLCDGAGCSQAAHTFCIGLPRVPDGSWFCRDCAPAHEEQQRQQQATSARLRRRSAAGEGGGRLLHRRRTRSLGESEDEEAVVVVDDVDQDEMAAAAAAARQRRRSGGRGEERRRANTLARELQRRHGTRMLPSTGECWLI